MEGGGRGRGGARVLTPRREKALDARDLAGSEPGGERERPEGIAGAQKPAEHDPEMWKEKEKGRKAHENAARPVGQNARAVDRAAAVDLTAPEGRRVEPLVPMRHEDPGVVPELSAGPLQNRGRERGVRAEIGFDKAHR